MKISVIGPTHPFRGGVSHYTTLLVRKLRPIHEVQFISYLRQYPVFLYPGATDHDPSKDLVIGELPDFRFDALNPWQWWKVSGQVAKRQPDLVILPWSAFYWSPFYWIFLSGLRRFNSLKVLFICHNVIEHEGSYFKSAISRVVLKRGDFYLTHSERDKDHLLAWLGRNRGDDIKVCVHPVYPPFISGRIQTSEARSRLGIQAERVLLFFGFIREYKGLKYLLRSLPQILKEFPVHLVIAGEVWGNPSPYIKLILKLGITRNVTFINRYIPNEEVSIFFDAADLVVIPYVTATQSGVVQLSFGFGKPVVVGNVGGLPEAVEDGKTGFLVPPRDADAIAQAVIKFYRKGYGSEMAIAIQSMLSKDSWLLLTRTIEELVKSVNLHRVSAGIKAM